MANSIQYISFAKMLHPITKKEVSKNSSWKGQYFSWLPAIVHYGVVLLPLILVIGFYTVFGISNYTICYMIGATFWFFYSCLYPGNKIKSSGPCLTEIPTCENEVGEKQVAVANVAVIGGGPAGIVTAKELLEAGHKVDLYDEFPTLGGEFSNRFYPGGLLTSSPYVTAFSDFEPLKDPATGKEHYAHHTKEEYTAYLNAYSERFGVLKVSHLNTRITEVREKSDPKTGGDAVFYLDVKDLTSGVTRTDGPFKHVAVCVGQNSLPKSLFPTISGMEKFKGKILHSSDFWKRSKDDVNKGYQDLAGKRVLTVGLGEGMSDILHIITTMKTPPSTINASVRGGVFVIPRVNPLNKQNNDFDSTRLRYALPKFVHNLTIMLCSKLTKHFGGSVNKPNSERDVRFYLLEKLTAGAAYVRATKSDNFVSDVVASKIELRAGIDRLEGSTCYFNDGTTMQNVEAIVMGTGFGISDKTYPFFEYFDNLPISCPASRYMRMFDPNYGDSLCFIGAGVRPLVGSTPTICEMQARLFARIVSGKNKLPTKDDMKNLISKARMYDEKNFSRGNENWKGLVDWIPYMDMIAAEIGCIPKRSVMFKNCGLWFKLLCGPMCAFQYRLVGPGSEGGKAKLAEDIIMKLPIGTRKRDLLFFAGIQLAIALITWPINLLRLVVQYVINFTKKSQNAERTQDAIPALLRCSESIHDPSSRRPPLVEDPNIECMIKEDPERTLKQLKRSYGSVFRFNNAASGKSTVVILDKNMADNVLKSKSISFFHASYQSKIRFGLKQMVQNPEAAQNLSTFFRKTLAGTKNAKAFAERFETSIHTRIKNFASLLPSSVETNPVRMSLQTLVAKVFFPANVDALFGNDFYYPDLYEDYMTFNESMTGRSASSSSATMKSSTAISAKKEDAVKRIIAKIRRIRTHATKTSGNYSIFQDIPAKLKNNVSNEEELDRLGLLLLWGANVNMLNTTVWTIARLLKNPVLRRSLHEEWEQAMSAPAGESISDNEQHHRPKMIAALAEILRLSNATNMYRVVTEDVDIGVGDNNSSINDSFRLRAGEWTWMYPRMYLHYNSEEYKDPTTFDESRFVRSSKCPFRIGFSGLRIFGGGVAPCPGKDYSVLVLKALVDRIVLSNELIEIRLEKPGMPLPEASFGGVSSTPPPAKDISVKIWRRNSID